MKLYAGIDLHSNNSVVSVLDEQDRIIAERRMPNDLNAITELLNPYANALEGIVVESTFNWYWLVDGLMDADFTVHLANTSAIRQYEGLKHTDDRHDARWLAHILRLGLLPKGYIYPKEQRAVRDLLRKRSQLVQQRTSNLLSIQNLIAREFGRQMNGNEIKKLVAESAPRWPLDSPFGLAVSAHLSVMRTLDEQITHIEKAVLEKCRLSKEYAALLSVPGIGKILGLTIMLETGDIQRFNSAGNFASYCRCVASQRMSNGKKKGENNTKSGNRYLSWAFVEAANFAKRYNERINRFYQRKKAKRNGVVAIKAVAHKLARASFHIMRKGQPFDIDKAFTG